MDRHEIRRSIVPADDIPPEVAVSRPKDWVDELIEMTRPGLDMELPERGLLSRMLFFDDDDPS